MGDPRPSRFCRRAMCVTSDASLTTQNTGRERQFRKDLPMKTLTAIFPLAALLLATPPSFAEPTGRVEITFHYNVDAPPEVTLVRLRDEANKACSYAIGRPDVSRVDRACARRLIAQTIDTIGDARLSELGGRPVQPGATASGR